MFFKNKINITVLITSINQRKITLETANYFSNICNEVILVDEEKPQLSLSEIKILKKKGIEYIPYKNVTNEFLISIYQKRLIAANQASNKYVVHSNHDERYTYHGLLACVSELENNKDLIFCAGQAVAVRKAEKEIYYARSYKNLSEYKNISGVKMRIYNHAEKYVPIAHYSVWRKIFFIDTLERTIFVHDTISSNPSLLDELIFEFSADLSGNSKAINEIYWVRNRINTPSIPANKYNLQHSLKIFENKMNLLLGNLNDFKVGILINVLYENLPLLQTKSFFEKSILLIKLIIKKVFNLKTKEKKRAENFDNIEHLLNDSKINYEKKDIKYLLDSMK